MNPVVVSSDNSTENESPVDFAYRRFGQHLTPGDRTGWLTYLGWLTKDSKNKSAGERSNSMGGTAVYISDSEVRVFGPDYPGHGFPASGGAGDGPPFALRQALRVPTESWMMVLFGQAGVLPGLLHLNRAGDQETVYYFKRPLRYRPRIVRRLVDAFVVTPVRGGAMAQMAYRYRDFLAGRPAESAMARALTDYPHLEQPLRAYIESGMPPGILAQAMTIYYPEGCHHV